MIQNVKIIKAVQGPEGLQLTLKVAGNVCIELPQETALLILQGFSVVTASELEGKWCLVDVARSGLVSYIGPIAQNILLSDKQKDILTQMKSEVLYSAYELDVTFETLDELCSVGLLHQQIVKDGPITFMKYGKIGDL